jgi:ABC-type branched-subunit amino acid transport system permease subunit
LPVAPGANARMGLLGSATKSRPSLLALLCGTLLGGIAGTLLGALIARRRGVYFAMVTIAFGQVFYYIAFQWSSVTGGDDGLRGFSRQPLDLGVARIDILSSANAFYYFVVFCLALAIGLMGFILRSPFGRTMIAIRENERRARFHGIHVDRHIWIAFTLSCVFMGFAGALYALLNNFADPRGLHYSQSGDFVMMAVMGGMRSLWGPLLGAAVFVMLQDVVREDCGDRQRCSLPSTQHAPIASPAVCGATWISCSRGSIIRQDTVSCSRRQRRPPWRLCGKLASASGRRMPDRAICSHPYP